MDEFENQLKKLQIPYPQKRELELEVYSDISNDGGKGLAFLPEDLDELYQIHNTAFFKSLNKLSQKLRAKCEIAVTLIPIILLLTYLAREGFMFEFIREGGFPMLIIIAISLPLLYREVLNMFRLFIVKDHSKKNLSLDTPSVLLGCLTLICLGFGGTGTGLYYTARGVVAVGLSNEMMLTALTGLKESLGSIILGSVAASLVLVMHYTSRRLMVRWEAPLVE